MRQVITSKDNEKIRIFKRIATTKKQREKFGAFVLEGQRLIYESWKEKADIKYVMISEFWAMQDEFLVEEYEEKFGNVYIIPSEIAHYIALTEHSQGVFAVCGLRKHKSAAELVKKGGRYVVTVRIQDPGNMGTIIRTADAMGVDGVIAVNCCDIYNPKTVRSTMGSLFRADIAFADEDELFEVLKNNEIASFASVIDSDARSLTNCNFKNGAAVLIGNEGNGLDDEIVQKCDERLTIQMKGNVNSLNAATAASIIMWELVK